MLSSEYRYGPRLDVHLMQDTGRWMNMPRWHHRWGWTK